MTKPSTVRPLTSTRPKRNPAAVKLPPTHPKLSDSHRLSVSSLHGKPSMLARNASGHAIAPSQSICSLFSSDIWITEAQLSSAWARFVHALLPKHPERRGHENPFRRTTLSSNQQVAGFRHLHCSRILHERNVPGPLEARRRATKRRMTELSTTPLLPSGIEPYGPSLFDSIGSYISPPHEPLLLWRPPGKPPENPKTNWLLRRLFDSPERTGSTLENISDCVPASKYFDFTLNREELSDNKLLKDQWHSKLLSCRSLADIRRQVIESNVSLRDLTVSRMAFQRLMDLGDDVSCLEFLSDRDMNPPHSHNLVQFLQIKFLELRVDFESTSRHTTEAVQRLQMIQEWIQNEVSLASMSENEIRGILALSQRPYQDRRDVRKSALMMPNTITLIWDALKASTVRKIHDLEDATVMALFISAAKLRKARNGVALASEMISQLQPRHKDGDCERAVTCLIAFTNNFMSEVKEDIPLIFKNGRVSGKETFVLQILNQLPIHIAASAAARLLEHLLREGRPNVRSRRNTLFEDSKSIADNLILHGWLEDIFSSPQNQKFLESLRKETSVTTLRRLEKEIAQAKPRIIAAYLQSFVNPRHAATFMSKYCFPRLSHRSNHEVSIGKSLGLVQSSSQPETFRYLDILERARSLRPTAYKKIVLRFFSIMKHLPNERVLKEITKELRSQHVLSLEELTAAIKSLSYSNHVNATTLAQADPDLKIERLPSLAVAILERPGVNKGILFCLISNSVRRDRVEHLSRVNAPLSEELLGFLLFVANRLAISTKHNYNFTRRRLWQISKAIPRPIMTDRAYLLSLASKYNKFQPNKAATITESFVYALITKRLREGRLVPMGVQNWLVPSMEKEYKLATSIDIRKTTEEWTRKNWLAHHREKTAERNAYNKAMKRMRRTNHT